MTAMVLHQFRVTLFVQIDQLFCHCVFIYANVRWQLVFLLRDGSLSYFCLLAESYETINQSFNIVSIVLLIVCHLYGLSSQGLQWLIKALMQKVFLILLKFFSIFFGGCEGFLPKFLKLARKILQRKWPPKKTRKTTAFLFMLVALQTPF